MFKRSHRVSLDILPSLLRPTCVLTVIIQEQAAQASDWVIRDFFLWLGADNLTYQKDLERALSFKFPGTCEWIVNNEAYKKFLAERKSSVIWLYGKAGCGVSETSCRNGSYAADELTLEVENRSVRSRR